jgi:hypothetical protein
VPVPLPLPVLPSPGKKKKNQLTSTSWVYFKQARYADAERLYKRALEVRSISITIYTASLSHSVGRRYRYCTSI